MFLTVGWGTFSSQQSLDFLRVQNGIIRVHEGSPSGPVVATVSWLTGEVTYWTAPFRFTPPPGAPKPQPRWQTRMYAPMGSFASGTYFVDADLQSPRGSTRINFAERQPPFTLQMTHFNIPTPPFQREPRVELPSH